MGLNFLVLLVVGTLRPVRSAVALTGLAEGDFFQVYFVSAVVVMAAPVYNRLADRMAWRQLIQRTAFFFAGSMVVLRLIYNDEAPWFGLFFYGWYDLLAASLVTQFFMLTQLVYSARDAKKAYPWVIAAGSIGATVGAMTSYFLAERIGAENMLLVAGGAIFVFAAGVGGSWAREADSEEGRPARQQRESKAEGGLSWGEAKRIFADPQVRIIAFAVLLTVLVKQFVDYQYNTLTGERFDTTESITEFMGLVDAVTQWLPVLVLAGMRPLLRRWGATKGILVFPTAVFLAAGALSVTLWLTATIALTVAVCARTTEKMFRYSAERTGREILYVAVDENLKLRAKNYIDVAIEKGIGKVLSGALLWISSVALAAFTVPERLTVVAVFGVLLAAVLFFVYWKAGRQYMGSLAKSFENRLATLRETFVSLSDAGAMGLARQGLQSRSPVRVAFMLDVLRSSRRGDVASLSPEIHELTRHERREIRLAALRALARSRSEADPEIVRDRLRDLSARVRAAAVRVLAENTGRRRREVVGELLDSPDASVRAAALTYLRDFVSPETAAEITKPRLDQLLTDFSADELELALLSGLAPDNQNARATLRTLLPSENSAVSEAACVGAIRSGDEGLLRSVLSLLRISANRSVAREALMQAGSSVHQTLIEVLEDSDEHPRVRRGAASVLGESPSRSSAEIMVTSYLRPETPQAVDDQLLRSLHRMRTADPSLRFPEKLVVEAAVSEVDAIARYAQPALAARRLPRSRLTALFIRTLEEAAAERRAAILRWLALLYPPDVVSGARIALNGSSRKHRAKAIEWLETAVGSPTFARLAPALEGRYSGVPGEDDFVPGQGDEATGNSLEAVAGLGDDEDDWIALCARAVSISVESDSTDRDEAAMDLIEKVFLLQDIDLFSGVGSRQLALVAAIANAEQLEAGAEIEKQGETAGALRVVVSGELEAQTGDGGKFRIGQGSASGTWSLFDEGPSLFTVRAAGPARVITILGDDFRDLMTDHPEVAADLLRGLSSRVRTLAAPVAGQGAGS